MAVLEKKLTLDDLKIGMKVKASQLSDILDTYIILTEDGSISFKDPETGRTIIGTQEEIDAYKASKGYN